MISVYALVFIPLRMIRSRTSHLDDSHQEYRRYHDYYQSCQSARKQPLTSMTIVTILVDLISSKAPTRLMALSA